jgi:transcriptional regulator with XRE-family HTH domain
LKNKTQEEVRLDLKAIGFRVREIRGFKLKQTDFAKILGIGQTQLSKYERGKSAPTPEILLKLKRFSKKSIDWILTGDMKG